MKMQRIGLTAQQLQELEESKKRTIELARQRDESRVIQLPLWQEGKWGSPNSFARSALFAAIQSKDRILVKDALIFSQQNFSVKYSGEQLNQEDMTVWLCLVDLARQQALGTECSFTAYGILKHMGLDDGGDQRKRLYENMKRLAGGLVEIRLDRSVYCGTLVDDFYVDEVSDQYKLTLNRKLINIFGDNDWTALNWEQRKQLRRKILAQKLHEYYSSHEFPTPVTLEFLHKVTGSNTKKTFKFKQSLKIALDELVKIAFLESYDINNNKVTAKRVRKASTEKNLNA